MKKFLIGCGIAAGVGVLLLVVGGLLSYAWVKKQLPHLDQVREARTTLTERFGQRDDYVPPLDGQLESARIELFVAVRESLLATRGEIGGRLETFMSRTDRPDWEGRNIFQKFVEGLSLARGGVGLFREAATYVGARAERLLAVEMGEGEYTYLFCLVSYAWLEWDPEAVLDREWFAKNDLEEAFYEFRSQHRRTFLKQMRSLRRELEAKSERSAAETQTLEMVSAALDAAHGDDFPFQGVLPPAWVAVLEPYRARFETTLPRQPGEYILESVEHLLDQDKNRGFQIKVD